MGIMAILNCDVRQVIFEFVGNLIHDDCMEELLDYTSRVYFTQWLEVIEPCYCKTFSALYKTRLHKYRFSKRNRNKYISDTLYANNTIANI